MKHRFRGQTLIGLLVVIAIIMVLFVMYFGPREGANGEKKSSVVVASMDRAKEVELSSNLSQIQSVIGMYRQDNEDRVPASLEELKSYAKFPEEMWINPVTKEPLVYDPATGTISAPGMRRPEAAAVNSAQDPAPAGDAPLQAPSMPGAPGIDIPAIPNSSLDSNAGGDATESE